MSADATGAGSAAGRQAVAFMTHRFDREVEERFLKLLGEVGESAVPRDVFILAEAAMPVPPAYEPLTCRFDFARLRKRARAVFGDRVVPGNGHLRSLDFRDRHPGYAQYWFVEYDALFAGHWGMFLDAFDDDPADLLAARVCAQDDDPGWTWRDSLDTAADAVADEHRLRAFFPVHRISQAGLDSVAGAVERGWTGHYEALMPTAAAADGLRLADIGGIGPWTPPERRDRFYLDFRAPDAFWRFGTLRFRPPVRAMPIRGLLYHPCKTAAERMPPMRRPSLLRTVAAYPRLTLGYALRFAIRLARALT